MYDINSTRGEILWVICVQVRYLFKFSGAPVIFLDGLEWIQAQIHSIQLVNYLTPGAPIYLYTIFRKA